jgi:hypothetical protein
MHREGPNRDFVHHTRSCGGRGRMVAREGKRCGRASGLLRAPCSAESTRSGRRSIHVVPVRAAARWRERSGRQDTFRRAYARPRPSKSRSLASCARVLSGAENSAAKVAKRSITRSLRTIYHPISTIDRDRRSLHRSLVAIDPRGEGEIGLQHPPSGWRACTACQSARRADASAVYFSCSPPPEGGGPSQGRAARTPRPPHPHARARACAMLSRLHDRCADKPKRCGDRAGRRTTPARRLAIAALLVSCSGIGPPWPQPGAGAGVSSGASYLEGRTDRASHCSSKAVPIDKAPSHAARPQIASAWSIAPGSPTHTGDRARARPLQPPCPSPGGHDGQAQSHYRSAKRGRNDEGIQDVRTGNNAMPDTGYNSVYNCRQMRRTVVEQRKISLQL